MNRTYQTGNMAFGNMGAGGATMTGATQRLGAHEFLEMNEELRTKAANIELYGVLINQARDPHLRDILTNQQRRMAQAYQMGVNLLSNQGQTSGMMPPHTPQVNVYERPQVGLNHPQSPAPNPGVQELSDRTIGTVALNLHKAGAVMRMHWALECVNPTLRMYISTAANTCQEMAFECWQYLNYNGYYQVPQLADHTMNTMIESYSY